MYCECNQRCKQAQLASDSACEDNSVLETLIARAKGDSQAQLLVPSLMSLLNEDTLLELWSESRLDVPPATIIDFYGI